MNGKYNTINNYVGISMKILIDDREDNNRIEFIKDNDFFKDAIVQRLDTGDIVFLQEGDTPDIAIEVKTIQDFVGSCRNRRMQAEALKMKEAYPFSFIVLYDDGKLNEEYVQYTLTEFYSNIISLVIRYKVPIFFAEDEYDFVILLETIANSIDRYDEPIEPPIVRAKNDNPMINVLIGLPKVGPKMARTLLDHFRTPGGVFNATDEELDNVPRLYSVSKAAIRRMR